MGDYTVINLDFRFSLLLKNSTLAASTLSFVRKTVGKNVLGQFFAFIFEQKRDRLQSIKMPNSSIIL